jgi:RNA polymerase sigma-70 factor (ECF subfamily)
LHKNVTYTNIVRHTNRVIILIKLKADTYYIERIISGEADYFSVLLERYSRPVFTLIVKMTGNREDAEELTQDVFLKVFRSLESFQGNSLFSTWLYSIAYRTTVSALRKKKAEQMMINDLTDDEQIDDEEETTANKEIQLAGLEKALAQLAPSDRALILLFYKEEHSVEELAAITGLTTANVKTRLHRIRKRLFALMNVMNE